jgi:hypothetical protein
VLVQKPALPKLLARRPSRQNLVLTGRIRYDPSMKEFLEIVFNAKTLSMQTEGLIVVAFIVWVVYSLWKTHWSESAALEKQKCRLEVTKLSIEVAAARKQHPDFMTDDRYAAPDAILQRAKAIKAVSKTKKTKWAHALLVGGISAAAFPVTVILYTLLHLPPGTSLATIGVVALIQGCFMVVSVAAGTVFNATLRDGDLILEIIFGVCVGAAFFIISSGIFTLFLKIYVVFRNAQFLAPASK